MTKSICLLLLMAACFGADAQDAKRLHEIGKNYLVDGDYANAESMLYSAYTADTNDISIIKDLTLCYFFEKDYARGIALMTPLIDRQQADDQCFQILGSLYRTQNNYASSMAIYTAAIKKYPDNGAFYNEIGELMQLNNDPQCIAFWERGIEKDPPYPSNYFNACKFYHASGDKIWAALYGEIYVNIDPLNARTVEIKDILLEDYTYMLTALVNEGMPKEKNKFAQKVFTTFNRQADVVKMGISTATLTMLRTRFILDWYQDKTDRFPCALFEYHQQLLRLGLFDAYNQWLFGSAENLSGFQFWTQLHNLEYGSFVKYQRSNVFSVPKGQYYH